MQLIKSERTFDVRKVEQMLIMENKYITDLFSVLCLPHRNIQDDEEQDESSIHPNNFKKKDTTRAKSLTELQERLQEITNKKRLTYKEKLIKKNIKNRMKRKSKQGERNIQQKLVHGQKTIKADGKTDPEVTNSYMKIAKPVFNSEGKMVFSKFDFSNLGIKKDKKQEKDPKKILKNLEKKKEKLNNLKESGEIGKVIELSEKTAWRNALAKAQGEKIKDDSSLLKKTVQRHEQKKRSNKKKWLARQESVIKTQEERQSRRSENIEKRRKEKKKNKLKKAVKKGKIIPGF